MRRKAASNPPVQQVSYHALPDAIQRKYFSSLERLQIHQQAVEEPTSGRSSRASNSRQTSSTPFCAFAKHRANKSETNVHIHDDSHVQVQVEVDFFLSLPPKLQKQHFSREEQELLLARSQRAQRRLKDFRFDLPKAAESKADLRRQRTKLPSPTLPSSPLPPPPKHTQSLPVKQSRPTLHLPTPVERAASRDSSLFYLDLMSPLFVIPTPPPTPNFRRTMSLSGPSVRYSTSSTVPTEDISVFGPAPPPRHQRTQSASQAGRRASHTPAVAPVFDPEAAHYQDPEARKKLRTYLACPQKFDEAIEFGFPSTADKDTATPHYQLPPIATHSRKFSQAMQSFLKDGTLSLPEDSRSENQGLDFDADSVTEVDSPTTPSSADPTFRMHSRRISQPKYSMDSTCPSSVYSASGHGNREMTLRMTLTRPDLRADEDQLHTWQSPPSKPVKDDPFALEDLVVTDDTTGAKGAFYVKPRMRGNLVTRLFKRASPKDK